MLLIQRYPDGVKCVIRRPLRRAWTAILEYELPRESRRPDVIVLENGVVVVLKFKWKAVAFSAPAP